MESDAKPFLELIIHKITKNYKKKLSDKIGINALHIIWAEESPQFYFATTTAFRKEEFMRYLKRAMVKKGFQNYVSTFTDQVDGPWVRD